MELVLRCFMWEWRQWHLNFQVTHFVEHGEGVGTWSRGKGCGSRLLKEVFASVQRFAPSLQPFQSLSARLHLSTSAAAAAAVFSLISGHTCEHHSNAATYIRVLRILHPSRSHPSSLPQAIYVKIAARADGGGGGLRREERRRGWADAASTKLCKNMVKPDIWFTVKHSLDIDAVGDI